MAQLGLLPPNLRVVTVEPPRLTRREPLAQYVPVPGATAVAAHQVGEVPAEVLRVRTGRHVEHPHRRGIIGSGRAQQEHQPEGGMDLLQNRPIGMNHNPR